MALLGISQLPSYTIAKLVASLLLAFYGLFATLTDLKVQRGNEKVLSHKGWFGLAILAIGSFGSLWADMQSAVDATQNENKRQAEHIVELKKEEAQFAGLFSEAERVLRPIGQPTLSYELTFGEDRVADFLKANADAGSSKNGDQCILRSVKMPQVDDANGVAGLFKNAGVKVLFDEHPFTVVSDSMHSDFRGENYPYKTTNAASPDLAFNPSTNHAHLIATESKLDIYESDNRISDVPTLMSSYVFIEIESPGGPLADAVRSNQKISSLVLNVGLEHYALKAGVKWQRDRSGMPYITGKFQDLFGATNVSDIEHISCY